MVSRGPLLEHQDGVFVVWIDRERGLKATAPDGWSLEYKIREAECELDATYQDFESCVIERVHGTIQGSPVDMTSVYEIGRGDDGGRQLLLQPDSKPVVSDVESRVRMLLRQLSPVRNSGKSRIAPSRRKSPSSPTRSARRPKAG